MKENKTVCGFMLRELIDNHELLHEAMKHLFQFYSEGKIKPVIDQVFALEEVSAVAIKTWFDVFHIYKYYQALYMHCSSVLQDTFPVLCLQCCNITSQLSACSVAI